MKICYTCGAEKPFSDYSPKKRSPDGLNRNCKACVNAAYRAAHPKSEEALPVRMRNYDILREKTDRGTTLVKFGDHAPRTKGLLRSAGPGLQSSMRFFDLE